MSKVNQVPNNVREAILLFLNILYDEIDKNSEANHFIVYADDYARKCIMAVTPLAERYMSEYAGHKIKLSFRAPNAEHKHGTLSFIKDTALTTLSRTVVDLIRRY